MKPAEMLKDMAAKLAENGYCAGIAYMFEYLQKEGIKDYGAMEREMIMRNALVVFRGGVARSMDAELKRFGL